MSLTPSPSYRDLLCYDQERGVLLLRDSHPDPLEQAFIQLTSLDEVVATLTHPPMQDDTLLAYIAGYGLVLVAHQRRDWPTEAQRAALIQADQALRSADPVAGATHALLDAALQVADTALLRGQKAEDALIRFLDARIAL